MLDDLINNRVAAVVIPDFAPPEKCRQFAKVISQATLEYYKVGEFAAFLLLSPTTPVPEPVR